MGVSVEDRDRLPLEGMVVDTRAGSPRKCGERGDANMATCLVHRPPRARSRGASLSAPMVEACRTPK